MSNAYIERMRRIQAEFNATRECLIYVTRNWQKKDIQLERALPQDVTQAERNIEATYLIRLYAEFEGILKDHLATNHPRIAVPDKPKVDWLISRVIQAEGVSLEQPLRVRMDDARLPKFGCPSGANRSFCIVRHSPLYIEHVSCQTARSPD